MLTQVEATELSKKLKFLSTSFVRDEYTGEKRIRTDECGVREKEYETLVKGSVMRFSSECELGAIKNVWFEFKWTDGKSRFEVEFEDEVPEEFRGRENIKGWYILKD